MHSATLFKTLVAVIAIPSLAISKENKITFPLKPEISTVHSQCFNYFANKDFCVWGAQDERLRCRITNGQHAYYPQKAVLMASSKEPKRLQRRYDTEWTKSPILPAKDGVCGRYYGRNTGACLWGHDNVPAGSASGGWLNENFKVNCKRQLWVSRKSNPQHKIYVPVVDKCDFPELKPGDTWPGCVQIGLTQAVFDLLKATDDEKKNGLTDLAWDYDNYDGSKPRFGAN